MLRVLAYWIVALGLTSAQPREAIAQPVAPSVATARVEAWIALARARRLASDTRWLRLVHYRRTVLGGYESEADAPPFFLAPGGKDQPQAELEATLRAFFAPGPDADAKGQQHPFCRFPARRKFLVQALGIPPGALPARRCAALGAFLEQLKPEGVTLIFSSYYLNNPASAFGHTFLRVERGRKPGAGDSDLLDYGVDYSATVDTGNALLYAIKGLMGLFPGYFRKLPYYTKVREYNDFESRDLWEYELQLSPDEVDNVARHLWELGSTYFAYYYLSENCSYHVLGLLETASPRLNLLDGLGFPVIPAETVKALYRNPGLVRNVHYRPSNRTALRQRLVGLEADELDFLARLISEPRAPFPAGMPTTRQVKVLDTALDLVDVQLARDLLKTRAELGDEAETQQELLLRRAEYDVQTEPERFAPPFRTMPHLGHGARRVGLGEGYATDSGFYQLLRFRLALHDVADGTLGYPTTATIEFLPFTLRYRIEQREPSLEEASLIRVESLSPWTRFDRPISFRVATGVTRLYDRGCEDCLSGYGEVGGGISLAPFGEGVLIYLMAEARLFAPVETGLADFFRIGGGPIGGVGLRFSPSLALWASGRWTYLPGQDPSTMWSLDGTLRWQYSRDFAFGVEASRHPEASWLQGVSYLYF